MLYHVTRERHREVVPQSLLTDLASKGFRHIDVSEGIARIKYSEKQFVALVAVFSHKRREILHSRSLYLGVTERAENAFYGIENIIALGHFTLTEISGSFRNGRFLSHSCFRFVRFEEGGFAVCSAESGAKLRFFRHARSQNSLGGACDGLESSKKNARNTLCERVSRILLFLRQIPEGEVERELKPCLKVGLTEVKGCL